MHRWISIACAVAALGSLSLTEFYRRENQRLQAQVRALSSDTSGGTSTRAVPPAQESSAAPVLDAGSVESGAAPERPAPRIGEVLTELSNSDIVAVADRLAKRRTRPTRIDIQLMKRLERSTDPRERSEMARSLIESPHNEARLAGIQELLKSSPREGLDLLIGFVDELVPEPFSPDRPLARTAILALADVPGPVAEQQLYRYLDSSDAGISTPAARALELRGVPRPMAQLIDEFRRDLGSDFAPRRQIAIGNLSSTRSPSAIPALVGALRDPSSAARRQAIGALSLIGDKSVIPELERLRNDPEPEVRDGAAQAILDLSAKETSPE